jgi:hypothetical protein
MKNHRKKAHRPFLSLTPAEREREAARFDRPIDVERECRPLTSKERAMFAKSGDLPSVSEFIFEIDVDLLDQAAGAARKRRISLDQFMDQAIRNMLSLADELPGARKSRKSA